MVDRVAESVELCQALEDLGADIVGDKSVAVGLDWMLGDMEVLHWAL